MHGDPAGRTAALKRALAESPTDAAARWHAGFVQVGPDWLRVEEAERQAATSSVLKEYRTLRDAAPPTVEGQIALARWCRREKLEDHERFHWAVVLQLAPGHPEARQRLQLTRYRGRYLPREQVAEMEAELARIEAAVEKWKPQVQGWAKAFASRDPAMRSAAAAELAELKDAEALPAIEEYLAGASAEAELAIVAYLSRLEDQVASDLLVRRAVLAGDPNVREAAAQALRPRSLFAYAPTLLGSLQAPLEFSYYTELVRSETPGHILEETVPTLPRVVFFSRQDPGRAKALQVRHDAAYQVAYQQHKETISLATLSLNRNREAWNTAIFQALRVATGQQLPNETQAWWKWWQQYNELATAQKPVVRRSNYSPQYILHAFSCFLPGTKVWLDTGPQAIERVRIGDRVLSQDPESGELSYRFVLDTTIRPPSRSLRIGLPNEEIAATLGHPMWVAGKGWRMAKEIAVGDQLHGVHGAVRVEYIERGPEAEAYNLVVAGTKTYFIGDHRILVHDNTARIPTRAVLPGFVADEVAGK